MAGPAGSILGQPGPPVTSTTAARNPMPTAATIAPVPVQDPRAQATAQNAANKPPATAAAAAPAATTAAPQITAPIADAEYNDQYARLLNSYNGALANYNAELPQNQANYTLASGQLTARQPGIQQGILSAANRSGILTSGLTGQRAGVAQTSYINQTGALQGKLTSANDAALQRWIAAQNAFNVGNATDLAAAQARILAANEAAGPTTPTAPTGPPSWQQLQSAVPKPVTAAQRAKSNAATRTLSPAQLRRMAAGKAAGK